MAHWWEVPGFSKSEENPTDFPRELFQQEVLDHIKNGIATKFYDHEIGDPVPGAKLSDYREDLKDAHIWIISPSPSASEKSHSYRTKIQQLKEALREQIDGTVTFHSLGYLKPKKPDDEEDEEDKQFEVLFEYDPENTKTVRLLYTDHRVAFEGHPEKVGR